MDDPAPLASLSLTHVFYDPSDPVSYLCAWLALVPQALCVVYVTLIWSSREAEVALLFAGQMACEAVNFALKRLIKEERPRRIHGKGYGMPSSHAQFAAFWAVALVLFLLVRHRPSRVVGQTTSTSTAGGGARRGTAQGGGGVRPWLFIERVAASALGLGLAGLVAWSRVYLGYHTVKQVLVGCLAGVLSAVAWFGITAVVREVGLLAWALEMPLARWLRIRDLVVEEDIPQAGWEKWEGRRITVRETKDR